MRIAETRSMQSGATPTNGWYQRRQQQAQPRDQDEAQVTEEILGATTEVRGGVCVYVCVCVCVCVCSRPCAVQA